MKSKKGKKAEIVIRNMAFEPWQTKMINDITYAFLSYFSLREKISVEFSATALHDENGASGDCYLRAAPNYMKIRLDPEILNNERRLRMVVIHELGHGLQIWLSSFSQMDLRKYMNTDNDILYRLHKHVLEEQNSYFVTGILKDWSKIERQYKPRPKRR